MENLFTNVLVNETIDIIINYINNHPLFLPLKINPSILRKILLTCTTEILFYDHLGNIYTQTMGSVLGQIFSNFYLSNLENKIFNSIKKNLQYTLDMLMIYLFLLMILMK